MRNPSDQRRRDLERAVQAVPGDRAARAALLVERQRTGEIPSFPIDPAGREWWEVNPDPGHWPWSVAYASPPPFRHLNALALARWTDASEVGPGVELWLVQRTGWPAIHPEADFGGSFRDARAAGHPFVSRSIIFPTLNEHDPAIATWVSVLQRRPARVGATSVPPVPGMTLRGQAIEWTPGVEVQAAAAFLAADLFLRAHIALTWRATMFDVEASPLRERHGWSPDVLPAPPNEIVWGERSPAAWGAPGQTDPGPESGWRQLDYYFAALALRHGLEDPSELVRFGFPWKVELLDDDRFVSDLGFVPPLTFQRPLRGCDVCDDGDLLEPGEWCDACGLSRSEDGERFERL